MVPHKDVRVELPSEHRDRAPEDAQKSLPVFVIPEDRPTPVFPRRNVPDSAGNLKAKRDVPCTPSSNHISANLTLSSLAAFWAPFTPIH